MTHSSAGKIERFLEACETARRASLEGQRRATRGRMISLAHELRQRREWLEEQIEEGEAFLAAHPDHEQRDQFDEILAELIVEHGDLCRGLDQGLERWLGGREIAERMFDIAVEDGISEEDRRIGAGISERMRAWNAETRERRLAARRADRDRKEKRRHGSGKGKAKRVDTNAPALIGG